MAATCVPQFISLLALIALGCACPDGYFKHGNSCYFIPKQLATWPEAKVYCQSVGAELVIIDDVAEQNVLAAHLKASTTGYATRTFWMDGADYVEEGEWIWTRLRQKISTTHWAPGEPDNGDPLNQQHCIDMAGDVDYKWDDGHCHAKINFICEMPNEDIPVVG